jgi:hypothetical protein
MGLLDVPANNLAARATLKPNAGIGPGEETTILQFRSEDWFAQHLNVVLAPVIPKLAASTEIKTCVAIISWGTGGASTRAEVDFARGTEVQLAASFLSISGRNDGNVATNAEGTLDDTPGPQDVVAIISGAGSRGPFGRVTRTFYFTGLFAGGTASAAVPAFAKAFRVTRFPAATEIDVTIFDGLDSTGAPLEARDERAFGSGESAARVELYDHAGVVQVTNTGAAQIGALQIAFELCL